MKVLLLCISLFAGAEKPKYGPEVTLLSASHEYIRQAAAPDYWALSPYYTGQQSESACSLAAVTMIVNAARSGASLKSDERLASQGDLLKKLNDKDYEKAVAAGGPGITLDQMKDVLEKSLKAYGVKNPHIEVVRDFSKLHAHLIENEKSNRNFIVANFIQGLLTGDEMVGHFAPIAGFDQKRSRVLLMDPDREWYEPYWVSEAALTKAMHSPDAAATQGRGYLFIQL